MESKICFTCKKEQALRQYFRLPEKDYQLKSDKGHSIECRNCAYKRILKTGEKLHPYRKFTKLQGELRRFTSILMNKEEAFNYCFRMTDKERKLFLKKELSKQGLKPFNELNN
jgi:DNA-directed RNA polymerase subunit RPC12/RpoP